jgi:hypothetical protein
MSSLIHISQLLQPPFSLSRSLIAAEHDVRSYAVNGEYVFKKG